MMEISIPRAWKEEFAIAAELHRQIIREKQKIKIFDVLDHEQREHQRAKEKKAEKEWQHELEAIEASFATREQIGEFRAQLDDYDTRTVSALMDNGEALDRVHAMLKDMLERAYVLPDGRHLFKSEDGHSVFDQDGNDLSKIMDPASIEDGRPTWEAYKRGKDTEAKLKAERTGLIDFQTKVDDARARVDKGEITSKELKDLGDDLDASMPPSMLQTLNNGTPPVGADAKPRPNDLMPAKPSAVGADDEPVRRTAPMPAPM